ncbi:AAA domain-containing protein [Dehalococcoides sp.]|uniref:AAA domain-containing protein n=1 Tax=Dehalococcoides sp. TaxID=1966486 RepID=UPI002ACB0852|nr:AAA domain-containing protein [Dehalococcoides sp.]
MSEYEKVVWFNDAPEYRGCFSVLGPESDKLQDSTWLDIKQSPEPRSPAVPAPLNQWLEDNTTEDQHAEPQLRERITVVDSDDQYDPASADQRKTELLTDHPEVLREWERWKQDSWLPWVEIHSNWSSVDKVYFQLFSIYQQLKKLGERFELVLGLGLLTWETPNNQVIRRHIIVGDAHLSFDAYRAKFELQAAPEGVKLHLETDMVEQSYLPSLEQMKELESLLGMTQESPWNKEDIDKILRSFINSVSAHGVYSDSLYPPDKPTKIPTITFAPAIILRSRTQRSLIQCLNGIIEKIAKGDAIPSGIEILCEEPKSTEINDEVPEVSNDEFTDENIYLPLPTNEEQKQILYQIKNQNGILVQGPPGTGKSHTIANIICHLLAEGKRVLVTSQTPRALKVLKEKIPKETQALCVTLLGNDQVARQELENSVYGINQRYSEWDQFRSRRLITELEEHLYKIKKEKADKERLLRELREVNTYQHEVANGTYRGTAQQIAQKVASEESSYSWLQNEGGGDSPCPVSNIEFKELIRLHREMSKDYCSELRKELVVRDTLPDAEQFIKNIDEEQKARLEMSKSESRRNSTRYRTVRNASETDLGSLRKSVSDLLIARRGIRGKFEWIERAVLDILNGNDSPWNNLHDFMIEHLGILDKKIPIAQTLDVQLSGNSDLNKLRADSVDLLSHLEAGGGLGWKFIAPRVVRQNRYITTEIKVNGRLCNTPEQLRLLIIYLEAMSEIDLAWSAFHGKDKREEGSLLLQVGYLRERLDALYEVLKLKNLLDTGRKCLKTIVGLTEPQWDKLEDLEELILDIQAAESELAFKKVTSIFEDAIQKVRIAQSKSNSHDLNHDIQLALEGRDSRALAQCLEKLESLEKGRAALRQRESLKDRLSTAVPKLEYQIEKTSNESLWDARCTNFEAAWAWKLADNWVRRFGAEHDEIALESSLKRLTVEEQNTISRLSAAKAWDNCLRKLTAFQRSNLIAWATAMRRMPKTLTAKTRPKWLRQAQECMDNCRGAIPAWIMPLYRVFETIPPAPECFDVVIIDEASQTGPEGLILQYLAKQIIIVGDAQQISPDAIGVQQEEIDTLVKRHLEGIPFKGFYHPETSLFAFAEILFSGKVVLREHFRCMPEIIQFSNQLCYTGTPLKPLRQYPPRRLEPILLKHIKNGYREGSTNNVLNRPEADAVVEAIVEMCSSEEYAGKTMGVISLQGEAQAKYIESKLLTRLSPTDMETRRIVCGDAYAFQGDERDIMLLSMVAAANERIGVLNKEADKRRFNVAASRGKDQVILFHSATLNDLHPECMRYKLLEYYQNPFPRGGVEGVDLDTIRRLAKTLVRTKDNHPPPFGSWFEVDVCLDIADHGFKILPQFKVAEYRIDMVIEGTKSQLAVECDGDEWHGAEYYERDVARQRILERCGWRFWRIRGHEYYHNPADALDPLWNLLSDIGIKPPSANSSDNEVQVDVKEPEVESGAEQPAAMDLTEPEAKPYIKDEVESPQITDGYTNLLNRVFGEKQKQAKQKTPAEKTIKSTVDIVATPEVTEQTEISDYPPQFFFKLAHHARESAKFDPWERRLIFNIGTYLSRGWKITDKMERQALRILQVSKQSGLVDAVQQELDSSQVQKSAELPEQDSTDSTDDSTQITCSFCNKNFDSKYSFGLHLYDEHLPKRKDYPYDCPVCKKKFKYANRWGLALHWYQQHRNKTL